MKLTVIWICALLFFVLLIPSSAFSCPFGQVCCLPINLNEVEKSVIKTILEDPRFSDLKKINNYNLKVLSGCRYEEKDRFTIEGEYRTPKELSKYLISYKFIFSLNAEKEIYSGKVLIDNKTYQNLPKASSIINKLENNLRAQEFIEKFGVGDSQIEGKTLILVKDKNTDTGKVLFHGVRILFNAESLRFHSAFIPINMTYKYFPEVQKVLSQTEKSLKPGCSIDYDDYVNITYATSLPFYDPNKYLCYTYFSSVPVKGSVECMGDVSSSIKKIDTINSIGKLIPKDENVEKKGVLLTNNKKEQTLFDKISQNLQLFRIQTQILPCY